LTVNAWNGYHRPSLRKVLTLENEYILQCSAHSQIKCMVYLKPKTILIVHASSSSPRLTRFSEERAWVFAEKKPYCIFGWNFAAQSY
jgi:hypothetical protein